MKAAATAAIMDLEPYDRAKATRVGFVAAISEFIVATRLDKWGGSAAEDGLSWREDVDAWLQEMTRPPDTEVPQKDNVLSTDELPTLCAAAALGYAAMLNEGSYRPSLFESIVAQAITGPARFPIASASLLDDVVARAPEAGTKNRIAQVAVARALFRIGFTTSEIAAALQEARGVRVDTAHVRRMVAIERGHGALNSE